MLPDRPIYCSFMRVDCQAAMQQFGIPIPATIIRTSILRRTNPLSLVTTDRHTRAFRAILQDVRNLRD